MGDTIKKILLPLLNNDWLELYFYHQQYAMDIGEMISTIDFLIEKGFVNIEGRKIRITQEGKKELLVHKSKYFHLSDKYWLELPENMLFEKLKQNIIIDIDIAHLKKLEKNNTSD